MNTTYYKPVVETSYDFRRLKKQYPDCNKFYFHYYDGDYYNTAYTIFYDENKNELETESYSYYG